MTESADCRCESILSPQMEYVPGPHHDQDCPMRREPVKQDMRRDAWDVEGVES